MLDQPAHLLRWAVIESFKGNREWGERAAASSERLDSLLSEVVIQWRIIAAQRHQIGLEPYPVGYVNYVVERKWWPL